MRLGGYYLTGISNSNITPDAVHAHEMFNYAASYYGDRDAQYHLGRMYLDGQGVRKDAKQGIRWLSLAPNKRQYQAQAVFGALLFKGEYVLRDAARGLMWLSSLGTQLLRRSTDQFSAALEQATPDERRRALDLLKRWIKQSRSGRGEQF